MGVNISVERNNYYNIVRPHDSLKYKEYNLNDEAVINVYQKGST